MTKREVGNLKKEIILDKVLEKEGAGDLQPGGLTSSKRKWALWWVLLITNFF